MIDDMQSHVEYIIRLISTALFESHLTKADIVIHGGNFKNDVFELNGYCWCDGNRADHLEGCPPNFNIRLDLNDYLTVSWYKHLGRSTKQSPQVDCFKALEILSKCVESIKRQMFMDEIDIKRE